AVVGERTQRLQPSPDPEPPAAAPFFVQHPDRWSMGPPEFEARSDGKTLWTIERDRKRFIRHEDFWTRDFGCHLLAGFERALVADGKIPADLRLSRETFDDRACLAARFALPAGFDRTLYFDLATLWPAGMEQTQKDGLHLTVVYRNVHAAKPRAP